MEIKDFAELLYGSGVLKFGDFRLKSGKRSPFFLNFGELRTGSQLSALGDALADTIAGSLVTPPEVVLGPPYKAISMAAVTVTSLWRRHQIEAAMMTFRKEAKEHGERGNFLGHQLRGGESMVLVDDVMTSGQTKVDAIEMLRASARELGLEAPKFVAVVVGVDRQEIEAGVTAAEDFSGQTGIPVYSVATIRQLVEALEPRLSDDELSSLRVYQA